MKKIELIESIQLLHRFFSNQPINRISANQFQTIESNTIPPQILQRKEKEIDQSEPEVNYDDNETDTLKAGKTLLTSSRSFSNSFPEYPDELKERRDQMLLLRTRQQLMQIIKAQKEKLLHLKDDETHYLKTSFSWKADKMSLELDDTDLEKNKHHRRKKKSGPNNSRNGSKKNSTNENTETNLKLIYGPSETIGYIGSQTLKNYSFAEHVFHQTFLAMSNFKPRRILDFGCGTGSASIAALHEWDSIEYIQGVDASRSMLDAFSYFTHDLGRRITTRRTLSAVYQEAIQKKEFFDIGILSFTISEIVSQKLREETISKLWNLINPGGIMVVIEDGSFKGSHLVRSIRQTILDIQNENDKNARVVAPCTHDKACPMTRRPCRFVQLVHDLNFQKRQSNQLKLQTFSYVVLQKLSSSSSSFDDYENFDPTYVSPFPSAFELISNALSDPKNKYLHSITLPSENTESFTNTQSAEEQEEFTTSGDDDAHQEKSEKTNTNTDTSTDVDSSTDTDTCTDTDTDTCTDTDTSTDTDTDTEENSVTDDPNDIQSEEGDEEEEEEYEEDDSFDSLIPLDQLRSSIDPNNLKIDWTEYAAFPPKINRDNYSRIIIQPIKSRKHVLVDICAPNGNLERLTLSKAHLKSIPGSYQAVRKASVGGLWPYIPFWGSKKSQTFFSPLGGDLVVRDDTGNIVKLSDKTKYFLNNKGSDNESEFDLPLTSSSDDDDK